MIRVYACNIFGIRWKSRGIHTYSLFREMWQHHKSAQQIFYSCCFILTLPSETKWKKTTSSASFSCLLRYCVTHWRSFLSYSMSDYHCYPSANITSGSPISGMDGNSGNSFRIFRYSSLTWLYFTIGNDSCAYFVDVCIWYLMHRVM